MAGLWELRSDGQKFVWSNNCTILRPPCRTGRQAAAGIFRHNAWTNSSAMFAQRKRDPLKDGCVPWLKKARHSLTVKSRDCSFKSGRADGGIR